MTNGISSFLPWRSSWLAGAIAAILLIFGLPLFLRMPPWADLTLYDAAAGSLLRGGVLYRDVFDTNLPGFVWLLSLVRATLGWSYEAIRLVDLAIVGGIVLVLDRFARDGGATKAVRLWSIASIVAFYPFLTEICHAQRDVWMLLPALIAARLRWRLFLAPLSPGGRGVGGEGANARIFRSGFFQGLLWGIAIWIKPHVVVPCAIIWLGTLFLVRQRSGLRGCAADFLGNLLGGAILGGLGVAYLWFTGAWVWFMEVFTFWNVSYLDRIFDWTEIEDRLELQGSWFPPWSYLHWVALPVAFATVLDGVTGWFSRSVSPYFWATAVDRTERLTRLFPSLLYLGWTLQAIGLQRSLHYAHVPEIFLLLTVLATQRWAFAFLTLVVIGVACALMATGRFDNHAGMWAGVMRAHDPIVATRHPISKRDDWQKWLNCWRFGLSENEYRARMWSLSRVGGFDPAPDWVELGEVADELRRRGVRDGDVIAWNDSPHAVYVLLQVRPGLRYCHMSTIQNIGPEHRARFYREALDAGKHAKYAVADLQYLWHEFPVLGLETQKPYAILQAEPREREVVAVIPPPGLDLGPGLIFPYTHPIVYRSGGGAGRYLILDLRERKP